MRTILVTRDTKGKCRVIEMNLIKNEDETYTITRFSGLIEGKKTSQPEIRITKGKVKRSISDQAILEYNALVKKARDKGYKTLEELGITDLNEVENVLGEEKTDANGVLKPMLCKVFDKTNQKLLEKT